MGSQDLVLLSFGVGYLVIQFLMIVLVVLRTLGLVWQLRDPRPSFPQGAEAGANYRMPSPVAFWKWFLFVQIDWRWLEPVAQVRLNHGFEEATLARRGNYDKVVREFVVSDVLGLARIRFQRTFPGDFQVLPGLGRLAHQPLMIRWSSGDEVSDPRGEPQGDRVDMRQYSHGDAPRTILWKVFARTRRLMVRIPERAMSAKPKVCAYLVTGPSDEPAAALCRAMLEMELLGPEWRFGCDGCEGQDHNRGAALERISRSGRSLQPEPDQLSNYLRQAQQDGYAQSIIVLPLDMAGREEQVRDHLLKSPIPAHLCFAIDGDGPKSKSAWQRWARHDPQSTLLQQQLQKAASIWKNFPGPVTLIDRKTGTLLGDLQVFARRSA